MTTKSPLARARDLRTVAGEDPEAVEPAAVLELLRYPERQVQREAATTLLSVVSEYPAVGAPAVDRLAHLLETADGDEVAFRGTLLRCLAHVAARHPGKVYSAKDAVLDVLDPAGGPPSAAATVCLVQLAEADPFPFLPHAETFGQLLANGAVPTRRHAAHLLTAVADAEPTAVASASAPLRDALTADEPQTVQKAASALGLLAAERPEEVRPALPALVDLLDHDASGVRANAAGALAELAASYPVAVAETLPTLTDSLDDPATGVRRNAVAVVLRLADERPGLASPASGGLIELLDDPDASVRRSACTALGHLENTLAVELLRTTAEDDPEPAVRESARWAVERIR